MAACYSPKIPWTGEPGRLQSMGSLSRTRLSNFPFTFPFMHWRRKWQPTPVFLPGESQGRGSLVGCRLWGRTESRLKRLSSSSSSFRIERKSTEVVPLLATRWQDFSTFLQMKGILLPSGLISLDGSNFGLTLLSRDLTLS